MRDLPKPPVHQQNKTASSSTQPETSAPDYRSYRTFLDSYKPKRPCGDDQESISSNDSGICESTAPKTLHPNGQSDHPIAPFATRTGSFRDYLENYNLKKFSSVKPTFNNGTTKPTTVKSEIVIQISDPSSSTNFHQNGDVPDSSSTPSETPPPPPPPPLPPSGNSNFHKTSRISPNPPPPPPPTSDFNKQQIRPDKSTSSAADALAKILKEHLSHTADSRTSSPSSSGAASPSSVDRNDPQVKKLVYNTYRGLLKAYNDKANDMVATLPRRIVREDRGIATQLESITLQGGLVERLNGRTNPSKVDED